MKFTSLLSAVLVFALSAVNAEKEQANLKFLQHLTVFPPIYRIQVDLLSSHTSHLIVLRSNKSYYIPYYTEISRGEVEYSQLPTGQFDAIINNNSAKSGNKTFRIDLSRPGAEFHFEGTSVTEEPVNDVRVEAVVKAAH